MPQIILYNIPRWPPPEQQDRITDQEVIDWLPQRAIAPYEAILPLPDIRLVFPPRAVLYEEGPLPEPPAPVGPFKFRMLDFPWPMQTLGEATLDFPFIETPAIGPFRPGPLPSVWWAKQPAVRLTEQEVIDWWPVPAIQPYLHLLPLPEMSLWKETPDRLTDQEIIDWLGREGIQPYIRLLPLPEMWLNRPQVGILYVEGPPPPTGEWISGGQPTVRPIAPLWWAKVPRNLISAPLWDILQPIPSNVRSVSGGSATMISRGLSYPETTGRPGSEKT